MKLYLVLIPLILIGCTTTQPIKVIVPCPKPNIPAEPYYPVQDLKQGNKPATVAKAYVATVQLQRDYIDELKHILKGYD